MFADSHLDFYDQGGFLYGKTGKKGGGEVH